MLKLNWSKIIGRIGVVFAILVIVFSSPLTAAACTRDTDCPRRHKCVRGRCIPIQALDNSTIFSWSSISSNTQSSQVCSYTSPLINN